MPGEDMEAGFVGQMNRLHLLDIINFYCMSMKTLGLILKGPGGRLGEIRIVGGEIVYAATGRLTGQAAFYDIAQWCGGQFSERHDLPPVSANIAGTSSTGLLLEAARRGDEARARAAGDPELADREEPPPPAPTNGDEQVSVPVPPVHRSAPKTVSESEAGPRHAPRMHHAKAQPLATPVPAKQKERATAAEPKPATKTSALEPKPPAPPRIRRAKAHPLEAPPAPPAEAAPVASSARPLPAPEDRPEAAPRAGGRHHGVSTAASMPEDRSAVPAETAAPTVSPWWSTTLLGDLLASLDQAAPGTLPLRWFPARRTADITNRNPSSRLVALLGGTEDVAPVMAACSAGFEAERLERGEVPVVRIGMGLRSAVYLSALTRPLPVLQGVPAVIWSQPDEVVARVRELDAGGATAAVVLCEDPDACARFVASKGGRGLLPVRCLTGRFDTWARLALSFRRIFRSLDEMAKES